MHSPFLNPYTFMGQKDLTPSKWRVWNTRPYDGGAATVLCGGQGTHVRAPLGYLTQLPRPQFVTHGPWDFVEQINRLTSL